MIFTVDVEEIIDFLFRVCSFVAAGYFYSAFRHGPHGLVDTWEQVSTLSSAI